MNTEVLFSSASGEWETPQKFYDAIDAVCHFSVDVCATAQNTKCSRFFAIEDNALLQRWSGMCWMNPPYGRGIIAWMKKAYEESLNGSAVVCLVPARTDTAWWHDYATKGYRLYIKGRLKFGGLDNSAPFPSALIIFGGSPHLVEKIQESLGKAGFASSN